MSSDITTYLKYANLQMAAESLFGITNLDATGAVKLAGSMDLTSLTKGNNRSSKFTTTQADQFLADGWAVVEHKSNTSTGFSGTLFKNTLTSELVLSFRSTEFADDAARDNQATNDLEIKSFGWAFGQISDMQSWVDGLLDSNKINLQQTLTVTGYSLGGHLAAAFDLLYPNAATSIYTFNGAGVGRLNNGINLNSVMSAFDQRRRTGSADLFTDASVKGLYDTYKNIVSYVNSVVTVDVINYALTEAKTLTTQLSPSTAGYGEALLLVKALQRSKDIAAEAVRVTNMLSGNGNNAVGVALTSIEAIGLDYQLAVLKAGEKTSNYGYEDAVRKALGGLPRTTENRTNVFDVYGATNPSMVSNSQGHLGISTPVWIEDQPLLRGSALAAVYSESSFANGIKLLAPNFYTNDFGDTHSLVLIVDSLSVQNLLFKIDPSLETSRFKKILTAASNAEVETGFSGNIGTDNQGKADGDTLERVVNALADMLGLGWKDNDRLKGSLDGNTWSLLTGPEGYTGRTKFYEKLKLVTDADAYLSLVGKANVVPFNQAADGRENFGTFLALSALSPFAIQTTDATAIAKLKQANESLAQSWEADAELTAAQRAVGLGVFTPGWYADRKAMLLGLATANEVNASANADGYIAAQIRFGNPNNVRFIDIEKNVLLQSNTSVSSPATASNEYVIFGSNAANTINGGSQGDRLYGGGGVDTINGGAGIDYIEGNAGDDTINGGADDDTVVGGAGNDTYIFEGAFGKDLLIDSDGLGSIKIGSDILNGGKANGKGKWISEDKKYEYALVVSAVAAQGATPASTQRDLIITRFGKTDDVITVRNFKIGNFGLTLESFADGGLASTTSTDGKATFFNSTPQIQDTPGHFIEDPFNRTQYFALNNLSPAPYDTAKGAAITVTSANSSVTGGYLDDVITGGGGTDVILGGGGKDYISGGGGRDYIMVGAGVEGSGYYGASSGALSGSYEGNPYFRMWSYQEALDSGMSVDPYEGVKVFGALHYQTSVHVVSTEEPEVKQYFKEGATVDGGTETDFIFGGIGNDNLYGGDGTFADYIKGGYGDDFINGGEGNDYLYGDGRYFDNTEGREHGRDLILGGDGNDRIAGGGNDDVLEGGDGDDDIFGDQDLGDIWVQKKLLGQDIAIEYRGNDYIDGGAGKDWLVGDAGNDVIFGGTGNDYLYGDDLTYENSPITIAGAAHGKDRLYGEEGDDQLVGGGNDDELYGGSGNDFLYGDGDGLAAEFHGKDYLDGGDGNDELYGNGGDDVLIGGEGDDFLVGGDGDDILDGGSGLNVMRGGAGNDTYIAHAGDKIVDGEGQNTIVLVGGLRNTTKASVPYSNGITLTWGGNLGSGLDAESLFIENSSVSNRTKIRFSDGSETTLGKLIGKTLEQPITTIGYEDNAELYGGLANDTVYAFGANSHLTGGGGDDVVVVSNRSQTVHYERGDGVDLLAGGDFGSVVALSGGFLAADLHLELDAQGAIFVRFGSGDGDRMRLNVLAEQLGQSRLIDRFTFDDGGSLSFADLLARGVRVLGTEQNDTLSGTNVADQFFGGVGANTMAGGQGADTYLIQAGSSNAISDGDGVNIVQLPAGVIWADVMLSRPDLELNDLLLTLADGTTVSLVRGLLNTDKFSFVLADGTIRSLQSMLAEVDILEVTGDNGANVMSGSDAGSALRGEGGNDVIWGGAGGDVLSGGEGDDSLAGAGGNDVMFGGLGNDVFLVGLNGGEDQIIDFEGNNTLRFDAGIDPSQVLVERVEDSTDVLITVSSGNSVLVRRALEGVVQSIEFADGPHWSYADLINRLTSSDGEPVVGDDLANVLEGSAGNDLMLGNRDDDILRGNNGNDELFGGDGADALFGNAGDDQLAGGDGDDALNGGAGSDVLDGGDGNDSFDFALGDGVDRLIDMSGSSVLRFGAGITLQNLALTRVTVDGGTYMRITYSAADAVLVKDGVLLGGAAFVFADGAQFTLTEVLTAASVDPLLTPAYTAGDDVILGYAGNDVLLGGAGVDRLEGRKGNDVLDGGTDSDTLVGGDGDDTYVMSQDSGTDTIVEALGQSSVISLAAGDESGLAYSRSGNSLQVSSASLDAGFFIANFYSGASSWTLRTAGGQELDLRTLAAAGTGDKTTEQRRDDFYARRIAEAGPFYFYSGKGAAFTDTGTRQVTDASGNEFSYSFTQNRALLESDDALIEASSDASTFDSSTTYLRTLTHTRTYQVQEVSHYTYTTTTVSSGRNIIVPSPGTRMGDFVLAGITVPSGWDTYRDSSGLWHLYELSKTYTTITPHFVTVTRQETTYEDVFRYVEQGSRTVQDVRGGDGANTIVLAGTSSKLVDAGGGNDTITRLADRKDDSLYGISNSAGPSDWVDGGAGDDIVKLGSGHDELIAGAGTDYLDGGAGNDTYVVSVDDEGWDTIYDSAAVTMQVDFVASYYGKLDEDLAVEFKTLLSSMSFEDSKRISGELIVSTANLNALMSIYQRRPAHDEQTAGYGTWLTRSTIQSQALDQLIADIQGVPFQSYYFGGILQAPFGNPQTENLRPDIVFTESNLAPSMKTYTDTVQFSAGISESDLQINWGVMEFDEGTRDVLLISWGSQGGLKVVMPEAGVAGVGVERFDFADGSTRTMHQMLALAPVRPANTNSVSAGATLAAVQAQEDQPFTFAIPPGAFAVTGERTLRFSATLANGEPLPDWLHLDARTGTLSGTPEAAEVGSLQIRVKAYQSAQSVATQTFALQVANVNDAPIAADGMSIGTLTATSEALFSWALPAGMFYDADQNDRLSLRVELADGSALPSWLKLNLATGKLEGTPDNHNAGELALRLVATDLAGAAGYQPFSINVIPVNHAPTLAAAPSSQETVADSLWTFSLPAGTFTDADADVLSYSAALDNGDAWPAWLDFDPISQTFSGTPTISDVGSLVLKVVATDPDGASVETSLILEIATPVGLTLVGTGTLQGTAYDDALTANGYQGQLIGGAGNDVLGANVGGGTWDTLYDGGEGDDTLVGSYARDTYMFNLGDGHDTLTDNQRVYNAWYFDAHINDQAFRDSPDYQDVIQFGQGVAKQDVTVTRAGDDMVLTLNASDSITIKSWYDASTAYRIEKISFADGTSWTYADLDAIVAGVVLPPTGINLSGTGTLQGTQYNDVLAASGAQGMLIGGAGNDTLTVIQHTGAIGDNTYEGGAGDDTLIGSYARDTYVFNLGDGHDTLTDNQRAYNPGYFDSHMNDQAFRDDPSYQDVIQFGEGVVKADVTVTRSGDDMVLALAGGNDSITIKSWYDASTAYRIENISFTDGTSWTYADLDAIVAGPASPPAGGVNLSGTGTLQGTPYDDVLTATSSGGHLIGGAGNDLLTVPHYSGTIGDNTYEGGEGDDTLIGSYAKDTYLFNLGDGHDTLTDDVRFYPNASAPNQYSANPNNPDYQDKIVFGTGITDDQLWFAQLGNDLEVSVIGTTDKITVKDWYASVFNQIELFQVGDGHALLNTQVDNLVQAMAAFSPPAPGETTLPANYQSSLEPVIAANWHGA